ncbi:SRCIN1 (predicted) [Pycnogonum litorale]
MFNAFVNVDDKRQPTAVKKQSEKRPERRSPAMDSSESSASSVSSDCEPNHRQKRHRVRFRNSLLYQVLKSPIGKKKQLATKSQQTSHMYNQRQQNMMYHQSQSSMYDDDPGILSEVETSSTGFRRGAKIRSSLPIVRTPSKSLERPLGVVFLQFRSETKRALLPNEVTSMDTVKALFVRSFSKQLTMEYLDSAHLRIYIHDPAKDMFYELEELRDVRDRSVLRIYEQDVNGLPGAPSWEQDVSYFSEPEFDSEYQHQHIHRAKRSQPPGSSGYYGSLGPVHSQTLPHRASLGPLRPMSPAPSTLERQKNIPPSMQGPPPAKPQRSSYQPPVSKIIRSSQTHSSSPPVPTGHGIPAGGMVYPVSPERRHEPQGAYRTAPERMYNALTSPDRRLAAAVYDESPDHHRPRSVHDPSGGYHSSPERSSRIDYAHHKSYPSYGSSNIEDGYFSDRGGYPISRGSGSGTGGGGGSDAGSRSGNLTPIIDEEARIRVHNMERQLASLTGIVQKALSTSPQGQRPQSISHDFEVNHYSNETDDRVNNLQSMESPESSSSTSTTEEVRPSGFVSRQTFREEKSVSFSDEPTNLSSPSQKQYSPQSSVEKPAKPAIKTSTSSSRCMHAEKDRPAAPGSSKPAPPPKPSSLASSYHDSRQGALFAESVMSSEIYSQLKQLRRKSKELKNEAKNLKKITQAQAVNVRETIKDTSQKIKTILSSSQIADEKLYSDRIKVSREEELYRQDVSKLEKDLAELEGSVEELRSNVINRRIRVNMCDVEGMALILSKASKTVADLKARFPSLQDNLKVVIAAEMEVVVREEKFLKEEPERLESALRRCKKLTGTLVTLKRLASVQEQRHSVTAGIVSHTQSMPERDNPEPDAVPSKTETNTNRVTTQPAIDAKHKHSNHKPENVLDDLLDELQTFSKIDGRKSQTINEPTQTNNSVPKHQPAYSNADSAIKRPPPPPPKMTIGKHSSDGIIKVTQSELDNLSSDHPRVNISQHDTSFESSKKLPPPPPPRTSSKSHNMSPVSSNVATETSKASPKVRQTHPSAPIRSNSEQSPVEAVRKIAVFRSSSVDNNPRRMSREEMLRTSAISDENIPKEILSSNSSSSESVNSQEGIQIELQKAMKSTNKLNKVNMMTEKKMLAANLVSRTRQEILEQRHQDLLRKQKQLQDQYAKLQQLQRGQLLTRFSPRGGLGLGDLKKTGSESNILSKASLTLAPIPSGSLTHLAIASATLPSSDKLTLANALLATAKTSATAPNSTSTSPSKVFETDIL